MTSIAGTAAPPEADRVQLDKEESEDVEEPTAVTVPSSKQERLLLKRSLLSTGWARTLGALDGATMASSSSLSRVATASPE